MVSFGRSCRFPAISCVGQEGEEIVMRLFPVVLIVIAVLAHPARAQDIPGIEICTAEKTMERRTSSLQSNVDFLQKTTTKLQLDHQKRLEAGSRQLEAMKASALPPQQRIDEFKS